ncbi:protein-export chaperone SecB [Lutibaculum baratangense]|uniref:Protein-export protein SecB n=1 Tax=Lutibaculum baratangense AMV1 TaxID=631454 RepID=V4RIY8_9HYPH|nr:protein-export chaperone SecB [Lutibaculum baratangense]ESR26051.1 Protein export cytoplasm chaperone protein (SecB, maintains protein to be exported in unfolded state) [Lutibaculum baratangense AMV1]
MADQGTNGEGTAAAAPQEGQQQAAPSINVVGQYIKDLSFENPRAPNSFQRSEKTPPLNVTVNVGAKPINETDVEVELKIDAKAGEGEEVMFAVELLYGGIFRVRNVPQQQLHPFILIECPRLLFPYARQIISETVAAGGFPPLMLDPIDFVSLYRQRQQQAQAAQAAQGGQTPGQA